MSKGVLLIQKTQLFQRAIFFSLLNPQPNGAGFAGIRVNTNLNLEEYKGICLNVRGQGENSRYKIVLRHRNLNDEPNPSYEQFFKVSLNGSNFETILLNFKEFKPYFRGKIVNDTIPLDQSKITNFGLQINGGVYMEEKQKGSSTLEINWISAFK